MQHFVFVLASVYNKKCLNTQTVTNQQLPKHQVEQNPAYQIDSLKKGINKKLFAKANSLIDKILSSLIKLSKPQSSILDGVKTGVSPADFPHQLCRKNADLPYISFTLFVAAFTSPTLVLNQNTERKRKEAGFHSKNERQNRQWMYMLGSASYGSVRNLEEACNGPVIKVRLFLHSKPSYTKFTLATHKLKKTKAFGTLTNEVWCMDLAHANTLAKEKKQCRVSTSSSRPG